MGIEIDNFSPAVPFKVMRIVGVIVGIFVGAVIYAPSRNFLSQSFFFMIPAGIFLVLSLMVFLSGITAETNKKQRIGMVQSFFLGCLPGLLFPFILHQLVKFIQ